MKKVTLFLMLMPMHAWAHGGLCGRHELQYFSCNVGKEVIAVCANEKSSLIQYRVGNSKQIKFRFPNTQSGPSGKFFYSQMSGARWTEQHLRFDDEQYTYVIFDRWHGQSPSEGNDKYQRGVSIFSKSAIPNDGEKAEYKRDLLVKEMLCGKSAALSVSRSTGNLETEDFIYGP